MKAGVVVEASVRVDGAVSGERLRLVALLLMAWQDVPVAGSRVRGESGSGEPVTVSGRTSSRRRDELLLRLDRPEGEGDVPGSVVELAAERAARAHPAFGALAVAMAKLRRVNPAAHRLLMRRLVGVCGDLVEVHALAEARLGEFPLRAALVGLSRLLPERLVFPPAVVGAVEGWEQWLAAVRPVRGKAGRTVASSISPGAQGQRRLFARALADAGWTQAEIGARLGVSQQAVSLMLKPTDVTDAFTFPNTPPSKRQESRERLEADRLRSAGRDVGGATVQELKANYQIADRERQRIHSGLSDDEIRVRELAWEAVRQARGW